MKNFGFVDYDDRYFPRHQRQNVRALGGGGACRGWSVLATSGDEPYATYRLFESELDGVIGVSLPTYAAQEEANYNIVVIEIDAERDRDHPRPVLRLLAPSMCLPVATSTRAATAWSRYRSRQKPGHFPGFHVTDEVASRVLSLPTGTDIAPSDVDLVVELVAGLVEHRPGGYCLGGARRAS